MTSLTTGSWLDAGFIGFDTETTGVRTGSDRIVTAAAITRVPNSPDVARSWLINPGVDIPTAASAVHGITTEYAQAHGASPESALEEIADELAQGLRQGIPVVAFNASFDLQILEAELERYGLATLRQRLGTGIGPVIDPLVLDRAVDRYRKGKRTLTHLCEVYQVIPSGDLHAAETDVRATLDVLEQILLLHPQLTDKSLGELHAYQQEAHRAWAQNFNEWLARQGRADGDGPSEIWPL